MSEFKKLRDCPSSHDLLDAVEGPVDGKWGLTIAAHLSRCEFCSAEFEFYKAYPPGPLVKRSSPAIPAPLRELAEALFVGAAIHIDAVNDMLDIRLGTERRSGRDRRSVSRTRPA